jgi:predicted 3-demethylubiquinone-9 3-methyltransferase (glyoxalase superfamily)
MQKITPFLWFDNDAEEAARFYTSIFKDSFFVNCETQAEVDELWEKLTDGGEPVRCGWLKDKYGLSWQIVPSVLGQMLQDKDAAKSRRVMEAMMTMIKLDIKTLQQAYAGEPT